MKKYFNLFFGLIFTISLSVSCNPNLNTQGDIPEVVVQYPKNQQKITDTSPLLDWAEIQGTDYYQCRWSYQKESLASASVIDAEVSECSIPSLILPGATILWQIRTVSYEGDLSSWSEVFSFTVEWKLNIAAAVPLDGGHYLDVQPVFLWTPAAEAVSYNIRWARNELLLGDAEIFPAFTNEFRCSEPLQVNNTCYWQVQALNEDGIASEWSSVYSFSLSSFVPLVEVQGGTFDMGDTWDGTGYFMDDAPVHAVTLSDFDIGMFEITFQQWKTIYDWAEQKGYEFGNAGKAGNNGVEGGDSSDEPVIGINWWNAAIWCNAVSEYCGLTPLYSNDGAVVRDATDDNSAVLNNLDWDQSAAGYRLPTEAEWEYAAKGGNTDTDPGFYAGSYNLYRYGWFFENSDRDSHPVGTKLPNELGIYDMSGNAREWCWDWMELYTAGSFTNPEGPDTGTYKIQRGGDWRVSEDYCRISHRRSLPPSYSADDLLGFRIVLQNSP